MARGRPDFGATAELKQIYGVNDLGELAVRLGSPVLFDRGGDVVLIEDFDGGVYQWMEHDGSSNGAGSKIEATQAKVRSGRNAAACVTGSDDTKSVDLRRSLNYPQDGKIGMEATFMPDVELDFIEMFPYVRDGVTMHVPKLRLDLDNDKIEVEDSDGNYQELASGVLYGLEVLQWSTVKVVVNISTMFYVRVIVNHNILDASAYDYVTSASANPPYFKPQIHFVGEAGENAITYVDNIILTQNEV